MLGEVAAILRAGSTRLAGSLEALAALAAHRSTVLLDISLMARIGLRALRRNTPSS
jgi:hypothetical protein